MLVLQSSDSHANKQMYTNNMKLNLTLVLEQATTVPIIHILLSDAVPEMSVFAIYSPLASTTPRPRRFVV